MSCISVSTLRNLSLWKKSPGSVPAWVWEQTELETLVLADNRLAEVSELVGKLKLLQMLDLGLRLPASLDRLTRLRYLNISAGSGR